MEEIRKNYVFIGKGVLRGCIISVVLLFILAIISTYASVDNSVISLGILIITMASVIYSSIYATKKIQSRGWVVGLLAALLYMFILYLTAVILGRGARIGTDDLLRVLLAMATGALSGMLGINL